MSLIEVLVGSMVFVLAATCSLQVWSSTASWSQQAERHRQEQQQQEAQLLAVQAALQQQAGILLDPNCATALQVLDGQLGGMAGMVPSVDGGLLVEAVADIGSSRQRWFDPAAYGLCGAGAVHAAAQGVDEARPVASDAGITAPDGAFTAPDSDGALSGADGALPALEP
jgi:hypothetical protein